MCGRFTLRTPASVVAQQFSLLEAPSLAPRFNIAPSQPVPVVRLKPELPAARRELVWLRWGLVPSWAEDARIGNRLINARAESAAVKPAFRAAMRRRRCLVVADGFYEWKKVGDRRQPYFVHFRDDRPFAFAGLWESWEGPDHSAVETCAILTTDSNDVVRPIHDRMPVILPPEAYDRWLDAATEEPRALLPLLEPYPGKEMEAYPVRAMVNRPTNDDPRCVEPQWQA